MPPFRKRLTGDDSGGDDVKDYFSAQGKKYEPESSRYGFLSVELLGFLTGKPWDEVALAYVSALRPSYIRVIRHNGSQTMDAMNDRVTVHLGEDDKIEDITQEVQVWLPERVAHGDALRIALKYGIDSPQCQWHNDDQIEGYHFDGINGGYYKMLKNGKSEPFPE
jgi:hypothetical protein